MPAGPVDRRVIALAVVIPLVVLGVIIAGAVGDGDSGDEPALTTTVASDPPDSSAPAAIDEAWNDALAEAVGPLGEALPELAEAAGRWSSGELDDAGLTEVLDRVEPIIVDVRRRAAGLAAHPDDALATPLVEQMAELYVRSVGAHRLALAATDDDVAAQYDRLGRRLRIIGDRVFDRARERTAAPVDVGEDIDLHLPAEVPNWPRLGLGAGPPLEPEDTDVDDLPLEREDERASQPLGDWRDAVDALDVPSVDDVRAALDARSLPQLGALARSAVAAAEALRDEAVPEGDRGGADRVAIGWLVRADAARAGQLAVLGATGDEGMSLAAAVLDIAAADVFTLGR